jgi:hypothetical protein
LAAEDSGLDEAHRAHAREIPTAQGGRHIIFKKPLRMYAGHKSDVIDLAWSKVCSNFISQLLVVHDHDLFLKYFHGLVLASLLMLKLDILCLYHLSRISCSLPQWTRLFVCGMSHAPSVCRCINILTLSLLWHFILWYEFAASCH